jgi:Stress up-regulated Nod 19
MTKRLTRCRLHHIDISVTGTDYTCPSNFLSTFLKGGDPSMGGARIYAGGNERVPVRLNSKQKYGIYPGWGTMGGAVELMSENVNPISVYVTMLFEFVPTNTPGYKEAKLVWVDVTNCAKTSDFTPSTGVYQKESQGFTMGHDGELLFGIGHMHDGGVHVELLVNGKLSCTSKQIYGNRRGHYTEPNDDKIILKGLSMPAGSHISDVGVCKDWGTVKKGDVLSVKAYFDGNTHMQMMNGRGSLEEQMGLMWTFIGLK